jgi:hypothetical protein
MDFQFDERKLKFFQRVLNNRVFFKIVLLFQAPLDFMIGMRLRELNEESCKVSVPYRWLNKNPFKSTFWAEKKRKRKKRGTFMQSVLRRRLWVDGLITNPAS